MRSSDGVVVKPMPLAPVGPCDLAPERAGYPYERVDTPAGPVYPRAHVVAYVRFWGPVPPGFHVHHLCRRRNCRAPLHLAAVSPSEHARLHAKPRGRCSIQDCGRRHYARGWCERHYQRGGRP